MTRSDVGYSAPFSVTYSARNLGDGYPYTYPTGVFQKPGHFFSTLEEEYTPNSIGSRRLWKDFEHYKAFRSFSDTGTGGVPCVARIFEYEPHLYDGITDNPRFGAFGYDSGGNQVRPFGEPGLPVNGLPEYRVYRSDGGFIPPPSNIDNLKAKSERTMLPGIKAELSAINSLIELKDFKSLIHTLSNLSNLLRMRFTTATSGRTLRQIVGGGADGFLQAQFNIFPLLSDIAGIQQAILKTKERVDALLRQSQMVQTRHYSVSVDEFNDSSDYSEGYYLWRQPTEMSSAFIQGTYGYLTRQVFNDPSRFHAEIEYSFSLSRYEVENAQLLGLLDALGINLNPSIIWNAIPWSFVVDWVIGVGRYLSDHGTTLNLDPQVYIRRYLWSIRRSRIVNVQRNVGNLYPGYGSPARSVALCSVRETAYRRANASLSESSFEASGLSLREIALGAALLVPRKWTPHRRPRWSINH